MSFTSTQLAALKAAVLADPILAAMTSGPGTDRAAIAAALSAEASPVVKAWRVAVAPQEVDEQSNWTTFDSLSAGKRDSWSHFFSFTRDYSRNKVRSWITDIWGSATAGSDAEKLLQVGLENARRCEVIIGGTTRTTGTVSGLDRSYIGIVTIDDVAAMFP